MNLREKPSPSNDNQQANFARAQREFYLHGQTPQDFIVARVNRIRVLATSEQAQISKDDIAYIAQYWIDKGVVTEQEIEKSVSRFGLSRDEKIVFISETMPKIREQTQEERREKMAEKYEERWGLQRLDQISRYYQKKQNQLIKINPRWGETVTRYQNRREHLEQELQQLDDPIARASKLEGELYYLTFLHPSEVEKIFITELESNSYVYMDSLLDASKVMYQTAPAKGFDFGTDDFGSGNAGIVSMYFPNDPESIRIVLRESAIENLVYGAKTTSETRTLWKKQITPSKRNYVVYTPPYNA